MGLGEASDSVAICYRSMWELVIMMQRAAGIGNEKEENSPQKGEKEMLGGCLTEKPEVRALNWKMV